MPDDYDSIWVNNGAQSVICDQFDGRSGVVEGLGPAAPAPEATHTAIVDVEQPPAPPSDVTCKQAHYPPVVWPTPRSAM